MNKIKSIVINGLRGVKKKIDLQLDGRSMIIYGDNGAGKSSITDAVEWHYSDSVEHLSNEEVGRDGKNALRNIFLPAEEDATIEIKFSKTELNNIKSIDQSLKVSDSNSSTEFAQYFEISKSENLILRYKDLVKFIVATKGEKLKSLQEIIGFSEVQEMRSLLKLISGRLTRQIKSNSYSDKKSAQQSILIESIGQNVTSSQQFYDKAIELVSTLGITQEIKNFDDVKAALKSIETNEESKTVEEIAFFNKIFDTLTAIHTEIENVQVDYISYYESYGKLGEDAAKISNLQLLALLSEGVKVLESEVFKENTCPLCEQDVDKVILLKSLNERIETLQEVKSEYETLNQNGETLKSDLRNIYTALHNLSKEKNLLLEINSEYKTDIDLLKDKITLIGKDLSKNILSNQVLENYEPLLIDLTLIEKVCIKAKAKAASLLEEIKGNKKLQIHTNLTRAFDAYQAYRKVEVEEEVLSKQQSTLNILYSEFVKRQEEALEGFLSTFSSDINNYYVEMNPDEQVENIILVPLKDKFDELSGITIEYTFYSTKQTPPVALLSESHLNCLGLAFFLASIKAFNKRNDFFILDDVISSFDRAHRTRFIRLLLKNFSDYQIVLLTHEKDFFEIASSEAKKKNWLIKSLSWSPEEGTFFEEAMTSLKSRIDEKFRIRNVDGLGNDIRKYGERQAKQIAFNIEANLAFRFNDRNEERMTNELFSAIQGRINKQSPNDLKALNLVDSLLASPMLIGNKTSHDNDFTEDINDLKVFNDDLQKLVNALYCVVPNCNSYVSMKNYDTVNQKIRCNCGNLTYDWKK